MIINVILIPVPVSGGWGLLELPYTFTVLVGI
jgi:hypothetical protein